MLQRSRPARQPTAFHVRLKGAMKKVMEMVMSRVKDKVEGYDLRLLHAVAYELRR